MDSDVGCKVQMLVGHGSNARLWCHSCKPMVVHESCCRFSPYVLVRDVGWWVGVSWVPPHPGGTSGVRSQPKGGCLPFSFHPPSSTPLLRKGLGPTSYDPMHPAQPDQTRSAIQATTTAGYHARLVCRASWGRRTPSMDTILCCSFPSHFWLCSKHDDTIVFE